MKIALLCPGPSLARYTGTDADLIVGVNRVPLSIKCDVWAVNDYPVIRKLYEQIIGFPAIVSRRQTLLDVRHRLGKFEKLVSVDDVKKQPPIKRWQQLTMTAAMVWALNNECTQLDIYGCDQAGTKDWDGLEWGEDRSEKRWADEKERYGLIVAWMVENGCEVNKMEL